MSSDHSGCLKSNKQELKCGSKVSMLRSFLSSDHFDSKRACDNPKSPKKSKKSRKSRNFKNNRKIRSID